MKNNSNYVLKLGMFVSIGVLLLIAAVYIIGSQQNLFNPTFRVKTIFKNVSGLKVGSNVRFSGINIGTVDYIQIESDTSVKVEAILQKDVQRFIRKDSRTSIGSEGLMGDKILIITPGSTSEEQADENDFLDSETPIDMDDIFASVKVSAENMEIITDQLAVITYNINNGNGAISKLIKDDGIATSLDKTMLNLQKSTKNLNENMEAAKSNFLLRGYFRKKEKQKEEAKEDEEKRIKKEKEEAEKKAKKEKEEAEKKAKKEKEEAEKKAKKG